MVPQSRVALFIGSVLLLWATVGWAKDISAMLVLKEIAKAGPNTVISKYFDRPEWRTILLGIGTADDDWLKVYVELRKGSDGESAEDLSAALWDVALPNAPYKEHDDSCSFTFEAECPPGGIEDYLSRLATALEQASTPAQHRMKNHCLDGIKKTQAAFPNPKVYCSQR